MNSPLPPLPTIDLIKRITRLMRIRKLETLRADSFAGCGASSPKNYASCREIG